MAPRISHSRPAGGPSIASDPPRRTNTHAAQSNRLIWSVSRLTVETMKYDEEFRLECYVWLNVTGGQQFINRLRRLVDQHEPALALELLNHPTMSDALIEIFDAAIEHLANQLAPHHFACDRSRISR